MASSDRISCVVPFCRRSAPATKFPEQSEIICGKCWRRVPKKYRRVYSRALRRWNRYRTPQLARVGNRLWERIKSSAIQAAAGLS